MVFLHEIAHMVWEKLMTPELKKEWKDLLKDTRYRKRREFYEIELSLLKQFIKNCDCMHMIVRSKTKNINDESCRYVLHVNKDAN